MELELRGTWLIKIEDEYFSAIIIGGRNSHGKAFHKIFLEIGNKTISETFNGYPLKTVVVRHLGQMIGNYAFPNRWDAAKKIKRRKGINEATRQRLLKAVGMIPLCVTPDTTNFQRHFLQLEEIVKICLPLENNFKKYLVNTKDIK